MKKSSIAIIILLLLSSAPAVAQFKWLNPAKGHGDTSTVDLDVRMSGEKPSVSMAGGELQVKLIVVISNGEIIEAELICLPEIAHRCFRIEEGDAFVLTKWKMLRPKGDRLRIAVTKFHHKR